MQHISLFSCTVEILNNLLLLCRYFESGTMRGCMKSVALQELSSWFEFDVIPVCVYTDVDTILYRESEEERKAQKKQLGTGKPQYLHTCYCTFLAKFCTFLPKNCTFPTPEVSKTLSVRLEPFLYVSARFCTFLHKILYFHAQIQPWGTKGWCLMDPMGMLPLWRSWCTSWRQALWRTSCVFGTFTGGKEKEITSEET